MVETIEPEGVEIKEGGAEVPPATPTEPTTAATAPVNTSMQQDANQIIADFFAEHYEKIFYRKDGSNNNLTPPLSVEEATMLGQFVAAATMITPMNNDSKRPLNYGLAETVNRPSMENFLTSSIGDYVKELDLFSDDDLMTKPTAMAEYLPEVGTVLDIFKHPYDAVTVYSLALSMDPTLRPMVILAIGERNYAHINPWQKTWTKELTPDTKSLVEVMKQYQQKAIKPVLDEIKRVKQLYMETWKLQ